MIYGVESSHISSLGITKAGNNELLSYINWEEWGTSSGGPTPIHRNQYGCHFRSPCEENKQNYD